MLDNGNYKTAIVPGEPIGGFFGYNYQGVYSTTEATYVRDANGEYIYQIGETNPMVMIQGGPVTYIYKAGDSNYEDRNFDGKIDELDLVYLGDTNPDFMGGFGPRLQYKNITLNAFLYFRVGQEIINQTRMDTEKMYDYDNQSVATNWRWRSEGDTTNVPRALYGEGFNWLGSSRFVEDGSFARLRNLTLGYDLKNLVNVKGVSKFRIYVSGTNLLTFTNYSGLDPEVGQQVTVEPGQAPQVQGTTAISGSGIPIVNFENGIDRGNYPVPKTIIAGIEITF